MALATRNLYLVLKARDEASRVVRGFGRELVSASKLAQAESLRNQAALARARATELRANGASEAKIAGVKRVADQLTAQAQALERSHRAAVRFNSALQTVASTVITVGASIGVAGGAGVAFFVDATKAAIDYERQVKMTATQVTGFQANVADLAKVGLDVAKSIAVPLAEIQPALYYIFSSTNASMAEATIMLQAFAKTAVAGQVSIQDAASGTIPILNAFNIPLDQVNRILDIQFQLVRMGVGTYANFSAVYGRLIPSLTRANQSFEEGAAMLAYLTRNGLTAAMAASSAARAVDAMSNPTAVKNMENLGITVRDAAGNMLPLEDVLRNLRTYLMSLPNADRVGALVEIFKGAGGTIQARRFLDQVLLRPGELEEFIKYLGDMQNSTGAFEDAYSLMADTVASKTQLLQNKWDVLKINVGNILMPITDFLITYVSKLLDWFNNLDPAMQKIIVTVAALGSVLAVAAGALLVVLGMLAGLGAAIMSAGSGFFIVVGALSAIVVGLGAFVAAIVLAWMKSAQFRDMIMDIFHWISHLWTDVIIPFAAGVKQAFDRDIRPSLEKVASVIREYVLPIFHQIMDYMLGEGMAAAKQFAQYLEVGLGLAFKAVGWAIEQLAPLFQRLSQYYQDHKQTIDQIIGALIWLFKWLGIIIAFITATVLVVIGVALVATFMAIASVIWVVVSAIVDLVDWIKGVVDWFKHWGDHMDWIGDKLKELFGGVDAHLSHVKETIGSAAGDFAAMLYDAGKNMIEGLVNGIKDSMSKVGDAMKGVASYIRGFFPASPAKWGPLSGAGSMIYAGQKMVQQLYDGMTMMQGQANGPASAVALGAQQAVLSAPSTGAQVNQSIVIHTQEINPAKHAAELGFLLAGRS